VTSLTWIAPEITRAEEPSNAAERESLEGWLQWHRSTLLSKCRGLTGEQLCQRAVEPSSLSLLGLVRHLTEVERAWFRIRFAEQKLDAIYFTEANLDGDLDDTDPARAEVDFAAYQEECRLADEAARGHGLDETFELRGKTFNLRWIYIHMIEEYARHNGHADFLRERIDGTTGD
jgi:uncharacterized damage-inducible protein DinB